MKLWRRRPFSVDLTDKELLAANQMPPSLVYISPGMNGISRKSSHINNDLFLKSNFSEVTNFNPEDNYTTNINKPNVDGCPLKSFKDYNKVQGVSFEDGTIRSSRISNKTYLTPVSADWLPVKDVMKIKRSASVPYPSEPSPGTSLPTLSTNIAANIRTQTSLVQKIRTLFRTRSNSNSSKTVLTPIDKCKPSKVCLRHSRVRTKNSNGCKSMYESSQLQNYEFSEELNHVLKDYGKRPIGLYIPESRSRTTITQNGQYFHKLNKKEDQSTENQKGIKNNNVHWNQYKPISSKGLSDSVISHVEYSDTKSKPSPLRTYNGQRLRSNTNFCQNEKKFPKSTVSKSIKSTSKVSMNINLYSENTKYELPIPQDLLQPNTATSCENKINQFHKSEPPNMNLCKIDTCKANQRNDYLLANEFISSNGQSDKYENVEERTNKRLEEDEYVRLAEIDLSVPPYIAQSIHGAIMSELAKSDHEYENIDLRNFQTNHNKSQPGVVKHTNNPKAVSNKPPDGLQKRRPVSCIAVVESENSKINHKNENKLSKLQPRNNFPKSPYLSQYTKLYSLKVANGQIMYAQQPDHLGSDLMTRSHTSWPYKTPTIFDKENSGKQSNECGYIDPLSIHFPTDSIIKTDL